VSIILNGSWQLNKEWGLIQAIGLGTFPAGKFTPFFFLTNEQQLTKKRKRSKKKRKSITYTIIVSCDC